jgi:hypothetical protein
MEMIVQRKAVYFYGKIKDLPAMLATYPPETTLLEFLQLHLN